MSAPRLLDAATLQENHDRFVRRAVEHELVWTICVDGAPLVAQADPDEDADTDEDEGEPRDVLLFFSDEAYARRALRETWPDEPDAAPESITLFDLLYRWLPGMHQDGALAGGNWTGDLIGLEVEPADLQAQLHAQMPAEMRAAYKARVEAEQG